MTYKCGTLNKNCKALSSSSSNVQRINLSKLVTADFGKFALNSNVHNVYFKIIFTGAMGGCHWPSLVFLGPTKKRHFRNTRTFDLKQHRLLVFSFHFQQHPLPNMHIGCFFLSSSIHSAGRNTCMSGWYMRYNIVNISRIDMYSGSKHMQCVPQDLISNDWGSRGSAGWRGKDELAMWFTESVASLQPSFFSQLTASRLDGPAGNHWYAMNTGGGS